MSTSHMNNIICLTAPLNNENIKKINFLYSKHCFSEILQPMHFNWQINLFLSALVGIIIIVCNLSSYMYMQLVKESDFFLGPM